jgi:phosphoglycerate dehydrogenase-like enzyme
MSKRSSLTLRGRTIAGADVSDTEPLRANFPFRSLQHLLATPHIESVVEDLYRTFCCHEAVAISLQTRELQKERQQRR